MLHEETSQPKASGISSKAGRPHPDGEPHSQSLQTQIQNRTYRVVKVHGNQVEIMGLQRKHLYGTHHRCEGDYTDR